MRKAQLLALWIGIILLLLTGFFPAWGYHTDSGAFVIVGHWFLLTPPDPPLTLDYRRLLLLWMMIGVGTGGAIVTLSFVAKSARFSVSTRDDEPRAQLEPEPQRADPRKAAAPAPNPFPWRRTAYTLYCWYLWLWVVLPINFLAAVALGLQAANAAPGLVRDWTAANAVVLGAVVVTLLYAQITWLRQMARSMNLFVGCFVAIAVVGLLNLMIGIGTPDETLRVAAGQTGLGQLCGGGFFAFIFRTMTAERYQRFFHVFELAKQRNVASPRREIGRLRLLRRFATGRYGRATPSRPPQPDTAKAGGQHRDHTRN